MAERESHGDGGADGSKVPAREWRVAVTEQLDETGRRMRRGSRLARNRQLEGHNRTNSEDRTKARP